MALTLNELMFKWYSNAINGVITSTVKIAGRDGSTVVSDSNALPVRVMSSAGTDRSITASTTSQSLIPLNTSRNKFYVKNDSAIDVWINIGATAIAVAGSGNLKIVANGGYFEFSGSTSAINIIAASGTPAITAREF